MADDSRDEAERRVGVGRNDRRFDADLVVDNGVPGLVDATELEESL